MSRPHPRRGAPLPYQVLAGVVPYADGWLAATAKLQGITMSPEEPQLFSSFLDVLDYKPAYQVVTVAIPVGLLDQPSPGGRRCEQDARRLLGLPRSAAIPSAPSRRALSCSSYEDARSANGGRLSIVSWKRMRHIAEVDEVMAPYWQRTVVEVNPELSFYQLNDDQPVRFSKHKRAGIEERRSLLKERIPQIERIIDARFPRVAAAHVLDAAACLWTARRVVSRAVNRLPEDPEWDNEGLRMEIVR